MGDYDDYIGEWEAGVMHTIVCIPGEDALDLLLCEGLLDMKN